MMILIQPPPFLMLLIQPHPCTSPLKMVKTPLKMVKMPIMKVPKLSQSQAHPSPTQPLSSKRLPRTCLHQRVGQRKRG